MAWQRLIVAIFSLLVLQMTLPARADPPSLTQGTVRDAVARFSPGDFFWAPDLAPEGPVLVVINRRTQRLVVYRNAIPIGISTVSTGRPGHTTPTGTFRVLQKRVEHYSSLYNNAPMPYMHRLTRGGIALHGGQLPGYPASHGCIRLPHEFARHLYSVTGLGTTVVITDRAALPALGLSADLTRTDRELASHADARAPIWLSQVAGSGPVAVVASLGSSRILVVRNGRIIGSAPMGGPGFSSLSALRLGSVRSEASQWSRIALPGQAIEPGPLLDPLDAFAIDPGTAQRLGALLHDGATLVLLPDALTLSS